MSNFSFMNTWLPVRSVAGLVGAVLAGGFLLLAGGAAWLAWTHLATGFDLLVFGYAVLAGACVLAALRLAYQFYSAARLRYTLDRNALTIYWGGLRQIIPLARIRQAVAVA